MHQGEQTYYYINDTLTRANLHHGLQMVNQFEKYYTFFSQGLGALEKERERVNELKLKLVEVSLRRRYLITPLGTES